MKRISESFINQDDSLGTNHFHYALLHIIIITYHITSLQVVDGIVMCDVNVLFYSMGLGIYNL